ncbi:hypothetical protein JHK85_017514 [Glycine max]|nr:hypothetical protein JHK85_017514 [Glycine max]
MMIQCERSSSVLKSLLQIVSPCKRDLGSFRRLWQHSESTFCVIDDRNLLRPSLNSKTGLHVLDLIDCGSLEPDRTLYNTLLKRCTQLGKLKEGKLVHFHVLNSNFKHDLVIQNSLLFMYARCGSLEGARRLFDEMPHRDMVSWTSMITGYAQNDRASDALLLFPRMLSDGAEPNEFTLSSLVKCCGYMASYNCGRQIHACCWKYGCHSNVFVGSSLVDMYARCGYLGEAMLVFDKLGCKNEVSWNALIAGYARKGEGEEALALFVRMQREGYRPTEFTYSALLSSCSSMGCLEQGKWLHAHLMKSGQNWVEIENSVHVFVANDVAHPQKEKIHKMWEKLNQKIKEIGYVPDTSHVLLFVDQQEKELNLQYHSEKLALSFSLLNTPPGSTIRIMKNIRVCGDCHSAIKYVSLVVKREIIVRDTNRFHHFRDGFCSCGDYW